MVKKVRVRSSFCSSENDVKDKANLFKLDPVSKEPIGRGVGLAGKRTEDGAIVASQLSSILLSDGLG